MTTTEPRFTVYDSQATSFRPRNTTINPRYWVIDSTTGLSIDEFTSKKAATETAKMLNHDEATR